MKLYRVNFKGAFYFIEAKDPVDAGEVWHQHRPSQKLEAEPEEVAPFPPVLRRLEP